jgi:hypothetical protein
VAVRADPSTLVSTGKPNVASATRHALPAENHLFQLVAQAVETTEFLYELLAGRTALFDQ